MTTTEATSGGVVPQWTVGDRLHKARTWAGISVESMAEDIGRSTRTIRNYEADVTVPPLLVLRQYAYRTRVPLWWLMAGEIDDPNGGRPLSHPPTDRYLAYIPDEYVIAELVAA